MTRLVTELHTRLVRSWKNLPVVQLGNAAASRAGQA
jgi:hypothetical protein